MNILKNRIVKQRKNKGDRRLWGKWALHFLAIAAVVAALGLLFEYIANYNILSQPSWNRGTFAIPASDITWEGFTEEDGKLYFDGNEGIITINLKNRYVDKLSYGFEYEGLLNLTAYVAVFNEYGELDSRDELTIVDRNSKLISESYLPINKKVNRVHLVVKQEELTESGLSYINFAAMPLGFTGFSISNVPSFQFHELYFLWCVMGIAAFLWFGRKFIGKRVEIAFLVISLSVGGLMVLSLPANKVSWDEEVHFERAFWLASYPKAKPISPAIYQEFFPGIDTWPFNQPDGIEEQRQLNEYLDRDGDYRNGSINWAAQTHKESVQGYAGQALLLKVGKLLGMPFSMLFKFGRLGNLLVYCFVMCWAIKTTPVGKAIMAFLGLMPTSMFLASVYSYDPTVTAFLFVSMAYILKELLTPDKEFSWKNGLIILVTFVIGCRSKAVYAPMILMALLIAKNKYKDKKEKTGMYAGVGLVFAAFMLSFVLPVLISPSETGDLRGGATSEVGQMAYVLGQPVAYARILIKNIWDVIPDYTMGTGALGQLGHIGVSSCGWLITAGAVLVIVTDTKSTTGIRLAGVHKVKMFIILAVTVALVWTSMYIAFTEPGNTFIEGVQGRYCIPLLFPLYLILSSRSIITHLKDEQYYPAIFGLASTILLFTYYKDILVPFCK